MILGTIIGREKTTLEEELIWVFPGEQGRIAKQMKSYDSLLVIGEIKKASPSKGVIIGNFSAARFTDAYDEASISAISTLTEHNFFRGGLEDIEIVRSVSDLPILHKDFIMDTREVVQTKHIGVNMMLLVVAMLDDATLREFYQLARFPDLEYIVEVHNEKELERALQLQPEIIGINNRDLHTFAVSLETTKHLTSRIPVDISVVSESGIFTHEDMEYIRKVGTDVVLIGENFMHCPDIRTYLQELKHGSCKAMRY